MGGRMLRFWLLGLLILTICLKSNSGYAAPNSLRDVSLRDVSLRDVPLGEAARGLEQDLGQLEQLLARMERDLRVQGAVSSYMEELGVTLGHLDRRIQEMRVGFASFEERIPQILKDETLQQLAHRRQAETRTSFEQRWAKLVSLATQLGQLEQIPKGEQLAVVKDCRQALGQLITRQHKPLDVSNLPVKGVSWEGNSSPVIDPPALSSLPTADDLAPIEEVSSNPSIIQLANTLEHDPLKIYAWVKDNIHYLPLFGSIKGALRCLWDREGTDFDQASLLIALLRAAKIPARYVYGQMKLPPKDAAEWLGVEESYVAQTILQMGGIPYRDEVIQRVWVKAYLDNAWVELDPAFKRGGWENDSAPDKELSWVGLPADEHKQLQTALGVPLLANSSLEGGQRRRVIKPASDSLPIYPSQSILTREWEATKVPLKLQYWLKLELGPFQGGAPHISVQLPISKVLTQGLSLLYLPLDEHEAKLMDALMLQLGDEDDPALDKIAHLPGYLVKVRPHLLLGDQVIARGEPVGLGTPQYLHLSFKAPLKPTQWEPTRWEPTRWEPTRWEPIAPLRHLVVAGACASLGLNMGNMSHKSLNSLGGESVIGGGLAKRFARYVTRLWNEELGLGAFKHTASAYHQQNSRLAQLLAQHNRVYAVPFIGEALVAQSAMVTYAFDIPVLFRYSGVNLDLQRNSFVVTPLGITPLETNPDRSRQFLAQAGVYGAMLEHRVLEQIDDRRLIGGEAISAVKAILLAKDQGVPLLHLTPENSTHTVGSQMWSQLRVNQAILNDIEAAISQGYEVILPQQELSLNDWQGLGYIVREAGTGAGAYLINGGLAGSFGGSAATSIRGGLPRGTLAKIIVIMLILAAIIIATAM